MLASVKSELLDTLNNPHSTLRKVYDSVIEYLSSGDCFVSVIDRRPRMFEAYMTLIEFARVESALVGFNKPQLDRIASSLRETDFTPLAPVLAAYIESRAAARLPIGRF